MINGHSPPFSAPRPIATCEAMALFFCVRMTRPPEPRLHPPSPRAPYGNAPHGSAWHGGLQACTPPNGAPGPLGQERAAQRTRRPTRIAGTCRTASAGGAGDKLALQWEEPGTHLLSNRRCRRHTCSPRIAGARCTAAAPQGPPPPRRGGQTVVERLVSGGGDGVGADMRDRVEHVRTAHRPFCMSGPVHAAASAPHPTFPQHMPLVGLLSAS